MKKQADPVKSGRPWTEPSAPLPTALPSCSAWPRISIVTPSYNQCDFIEETIRSVLTQGYPNLEYIVIDGGSTDGSVEIIRRYDRDLAFWVTEKDRGHYHALNKGFAQTTGEIMAWINSSDMYCPWTFAVVAQVFSQNPQIDWITTRFPLRWAENGMPIQCHEFRGYSKQAFYEGRYGAGTKRFRSIQYIQQESTFWRRRLWERAGGRLDERYAFAADFDLWARFYETSELIGVGIPLAGNRIHSHARNKETEYRAELLSIVARYSPGPHIRARKIAKWLRLHELPRIRSVVDDWLGYEMWSLEARPGDSRLEWQPSMVKKLV